MCLCANGPSAAARAPLSDERELARDALEQRAIRRRSRRVEVEVAGDHERARARELAHARRPAARSCTSRAARSVSSSPASRCRFQKSSSDAVLEREPHAQEALVGETVVRAVEPARARAERAARDRAQRAGARTSRVRSANRNPVSTPPLRSTTAWRGLRARARRSTPSSPARAPRRRRSSASRSPACARPDRLDTTRSGEPVHVVARAP